MIYYDFDLNTLIAASTQNNRSSSPYSHLKGWRVASFMVKAQDDLRREQLAMQFIRFLEQVWQAEEVGFCQINRKKKGGAVVYRVNAVVQKLRRRSFDHLSLCCTPMFISTYYLLSVQTRT